MVFASTPDKALSDTRGYDFPRPWQGWHQLISWGASILCHCFSLLYTLKYSNFFSGLKAALLQQPVSVLHGVVYICAASVYNLCPNFQVLHCYPTSDPGMPGARLQFRQQTLTAELAKSLWPLLLGLQFLINAYEEQEVFPVMVM